uniref:sulfatase-like hydrolase/transferase n=1 Tax=Pararhizobium sp. IMCC3301 TaxID=3067904 RepID=UPI002741CE98|nr:sulfatase-like hydrolase/transferase [Pararhizobium sp. IMCC3301]
MGAKPNFIFIIADDHRASSIGAHGCHGVLTPNLDALAKRGTDFLGAHCQGGFNAAVCVPSRATLMAGRSVFDLSPPNERDADDFSVGATIPPEMPTMPQHLRNAGYRTHAIGKWHNDKPSFVRSFSSADKILFDGMSEHEEMILQDHDPRGIYEESRARHVPGHSTDIFKDAALKFVETAKSDEPFFLYIAFTAPHDPRTPPTEFAVDPSSVALPKAYMPVHPFDNGEALIRDEMLEEFPRSPEAIRQHIADYYGIITHMDDAIGQIIKAAENRGLLENTIVVYTADHGLGLGNHGLMGKQNLYEHSLNIPLIIAGPNVPENKKSDALIWHGDTHATVLSFAGLEPAPQCAGTSLIAQDKNETNGSMRQYFGAVYRSSQRMIRDERYKLIRYYKDTTQRSSTNSPTSGSELIQLFDLQTDPEELINLVFVPEHRATRDRLCEAMKNWQAEMGDSCGACS